VILFGSIAENRFTPFSDLDLILIVTCSQERFFERYSKYVDFFKDMEIDLDIFVYTEEETKKKIPLLETALKKGKVLFSR
jgi:predicted nucleotidyltransferase